MTDSKFPRNLFPRNLTKSMKRDMRRWWRNLENGIEMTIEMEGKLTEESTLAELLDLCKEKLEEYSE